MSREFIEEETETTNTENMPTYIVIREIDFKKIHILITLKSENPMYWSGCGENRTPNPKLKGKISTLWEEI